MDSNHRFIMKPKFNNLSENGLIYKDILTYVAIRSYYNSKVKYCYPSYKTLAKRSGLGSKFLSQSIKRLEKAGYLEVWRMGKTRVSHCYKFKENGVFQKIPYAVLDCVGLTTHEKSMLLLLREYFNDSLECSLSISEIASSSGLSYRTLHNQLEALILKGYILQEIVESLESQTVSKGFRLSNKIAWKFKENSIRVSHETVFNVESIIDMWTKTKRAN